jgi:hypothetical protein
MKRIRKDSLNARSWDHPSHLLVKAVNGRLLRPCMGQGVSQGKESVLADSGWEGEITARVGRVRSLNFLSILRECSCVVVYLWTTEVLAHRHSFSSA